MRALLPRNVPAWPGHGIRKSKRVRILLLRKMFRNRRMKHGASRKKAMPCSLSLLRPPHPLPQILAHLLLPFSRPSGPTSKDQTEDAAASTTVVGAAEARYGAAAQAPGGTPGP